MRRLAVAVALAATVLAAGCSSSPEAVPPPPPTGPQQPGPTGLLRLGYMTDLPDAPALTGLQMGFLQADLGGVTLDPVPFASVAAEAQALLHGKLDAAYLDPVTAVAVWQASRNIRIVAGVASGGAELVVRHGITSPAQLAHATVAAPPGGAQQVALDWWLRENGIQRTAPGDSVLTGHYLASAIQSGKLAAAWEPAPADAEMVAAGGKVMVNEAALWPGGQFSTAVLVITSNFLVRHAAAVGLLLRGEIQAEQFMVTDRAAAEAAFNAKLAAVQGPALTRAVLTQSFAQMEYTSDPLASSILTEAQHAAASGLIGRVADLDGVFDLGPLNALLKAAGERQVSA
jgi:NitT/TauT family transport system substrate-binding protein